MELISRDEFMSGTPDIKPVLLRIRTKKPQALVSCDWRDIPTVMRSMRDLGMIDIPTLRIEAPAFPASDTPEMRSLYERNHSISTWYGFVESDPNPALAALRARFEQRFGSALSSDSLFAYDLARALAQASTPCRDSSGLNAQCFATHLSSRRFQGVMGDVFFGSDRNSVRPVLLIEVKNGRWVETK